MLALYLRETKTCKQNQISAQEEAKRNSFDHHDPSVVVDWVN